MQSIVTVLIRVERLAARGPMVAWLKLPGKRMRALGQTQTLPKVREQILARGKDR